MIQISGLTKSFGSQTLFNDIDLQLNIEEKVGLIGRNGNGKTTLFKILIGEEEADYGKVIIPKNYKIGYVKQNLNFIENTILKEASLGLPDNKKDDLWITEKTLFGLGFTKDMINSNPSILSGGYQVRLNLVKAIISEPNLLLLDEPTNYLDITSIRWLIQFLKEWKNELFIITHDRSFMDQIVTHTAIIHRQKIKKIKGNTSDLYNQIAQEEEIYERQRINDEVKTKKTELFISRFRAKARLANLVQSRVKEIAKKEKKEKLEKLKSIDIQFNYQPVQSQFMIEAESLTFGYEKDITLINNLSFKIHNKDRIAIIGPNGKGKSTLIKLLYGELTSQSGSIKKNPKLSVGYFGQTNKSTLHSEHTVEEEIALCHPTYNIQLARDIAGVLLFEQDDALKKIKVLSGGEKSRVMLGKILITPVNLLMLDEPTNHLDLESCDSLLTALDDFEGTIIIVTHNEMYLHAIANRLIIFDGEKIFTFEGTYQEFLDKIGWVEEIEENKELEKNKAENSINKKEIRKKRALIIEEKSKILKPIEKKYHELEKVIHELEDQNKKLQEELIKASANKAGELIGKISKNLHNIENDLEIKYKELDEVLKQHDEQSKKFENQLELNKE